MFKDTPKRINFQPRDHPDLLIDENSRFLVPPATVDVSELAGMFKRPAKAVTVTEMKQVIRKRRGPVMGISMNVFEAPVEDQCPR